MGARARHGQQKAYITTVLMKARRKYRKHLLAAQTPVPQGQACSGAAARKVRQEVDEERLEGREAERHQRQASDSLMAARTIR